MRIRRCKILYLEPREQTSFDLALVLSGGNGLRRERRWFALAPHLGEEVEVDAAECELLGALSPEEWIDGKQLVTTAATALKRLLARGLVIGAGKRHAAVRASDEALRGVHWHALAATLHAFTRWRDTDAVQSMQDTGTETASQLREVFGPPPAETIAHGDPDLRVALPRTPRGGFDELLARRVTCRNFDAARPLPLALFAQLIERVFAAQSLVRVGEDTVFFKKNSPSGGGLHPIEAYLVVQNVEGLAPGLYHYRADAHALESMASPEWPPHELAKVAVAGQHWFADAHAMVLLAPRYDRSFWKYRQHPKAHRAVVLEAGHLSQTLYLAATDAGLGAFVTCAINEVPLELAFGLDPCSDGVLAICGFGWRGQAMATLELDPANEVWQAAPGQG